MAIVAGEGIDEALLVRDALHRDCRQLQARHPAFGTTLQRRDLVRRQVEPHNVVEETRGVTL